MKQMLIAAAAVLLGAGVAVSTARADMNYGPIQNKGMCFNHPASSADAVFGYWAECQKPAAGPAVRRRSVKRT